MDKLVSIIIPLYNSEKYVEEGLLSCLGQSYKNIEVIVVDDGSTDSGLSIAKKIAKHDSRVKVIHTENHGVSSARNIGIKKSCGEYVCFVDADDCLDERFVEVMMSYMNKFGADFCISKTIQHDGSRGDNIGGSGLLMTSSDAEALLLGQEVAVGCWNKMYAREILSTHSFREDLFYGEGLYFIIQIAHDANKIAVCEDALYRYRKVNPGSATTAFSLSKMRNGEQSLLEIRKLVQDDGRVVNLVWAQHYCLFCINAMLGILRTGNGRSEYKRWKRKLSKYILSGLLAPGSLKMKVRLLIGSISPKLLLMISSRRKK